MFGKTMLDTLMVCILNFLWLVIIIGVYAYYKSKEEQRFLVLKERYVNIKMIRS